MQNNSRLCKVLSFLKYLFVKFEPSLWVMGGLDGPLQSQFFAAIFSHHNIRLSGM